MCQVDPLCVEMKARIEGATHALTELFEEHKSSSWGVLLIDATNAFNNFNRLSHYRILGYCGPGVLGTHLTLIGCIWSDNVLIQQKGVTQGI